MLSGAAITLPAAAPADAKSYLRIETGEEDALVARLMRSSAELCEQFTGQALIERAFTETVRAEAAWQRLAARPVRSISGVEALPADGDPFALPAGDYAVDIDANGDGWVRVTRPAAAARMRVSYQAGLAAEWASLPEALRQGIVRLAAHLYAHRDSAAGAAPPAAVTALWRPWRRMRLH